MIRRLWHNEHLRAAILVAAGLVFTFRDVVFQGHSFLTLNRSMGTMPEASERPELKGRLIWGYPGPVPVPGRSPILDICAQSLIIEPYEYFARSTLRRGELPLWNPHSGGGESHVGSGESSVFDPLQLPIYLAPRAWYPAVYDFSVLLRYFLAGFFTYLFARRLGTSFWGALFAGVLISQASYLVSYGNHAPVKVAVMMPLLFYALQRLVESVRPASVVLAAAATALCVVADFAQMTFCVLQFAVLYYVAVAAAMSWRAERRWRAAGARAAGLCATLVLGMALAAPMLLPMLENLGLCRSIHSAADMARLWHLPDTRRLLTLLSVPNTAGVFQPVSYYATALILGLSAPWTWRHASSGRVAGVFFLAAGLLSYANTLHLPGARWLGELPVYRETALLKYLPPVVEFALAILAGQAISGLSTRRRATLPLVAAALLFAALAGALWLQAELSIDTAVLNRRLALLALFAATPCLVVLLRDAFRLGPWLLCLGLLASLLMEVNLRNSDVGRSVRCHPYHTPPMLEFLAQQAGPYRIGSLGALTPNIAMAHGIDDVRYVAGLSPVRRHLYRRHFFTQAEQREALYFLGWEGLAFNRYYNLLNTRYYICVAAGPQGAADQKTERPQWDNGAPGDAKQFELVYKDEVRIYRNNWAYPRAFVVYRAEMAPHLTAADEILGRGDFDPSRQVVVEGARPDDWDAELFSAQPAPPGRPADEVLRTGASSLRIKARTERAGILVVSELYFPGWNAYVDGKRVPLLAADVMLRGVYLEPGEHVVEMRYQPRSFRYGLRLAGLAMLILLGLTLCPWRRRPEAGGNQP